MTTIKSDEGDPDMRPIALFVQNLGGGGAERVMAHLANGMAERGVPTDLVLLRRFGPYLAQVSPRVRLTVLDSSRNLSGLPRLIRYLRRERPVVLISALSHSNVLCLLAAALSGTGTPVIVTEHGLFSRTRQGARTRMAALAFRALPLAYRRAAGIVAVADGVADDLAAETGIARSRIAVIPNPVVTEGLLGQAAEPVDHPWFRPGEPPVILACGRLVALKGYDVLLHAFALVRRRRPARLLILGEGSERAALEALARELGVADDVSMPGFQANPYAFMANAAVFALTSAWEGLPTVVIEAMACGVPVVATDCTSGLADILDRGRLGRVVAVGDGTAVAEALVETLDHRPDTASARTWAMGYTIDRAVDAYFDVIERAVRTATRRPLALPRGHRDAPLPE